LKSAKPFTKERLWGKTFQFKSKVGGKAEEAHALRVPKARTLIRANVGKEALLLRPGDSSERDKPLSGQREVVGHRIDFRRESHRPGGESCAGGVAPHRRAERMDPLPKIADDRGVKNTCGPARKTRSSAPEFTQGKRISVLSREEGERSSSRRSSDAREGNDRLAI